MSLRVNPQRAQPRQSGEPLLSGQLTPPRSDSSEPSLSPTPAPPLSPVSSPAPAASLAKEELDIQQLHQKSAAASSRSSNGMQDHTRITLCAFLFLFLAFNPLGFIMNTAGPLNFDYSGRFEGRVLMEHKGRFYVYAKSTES